MRILRRKSLLSAGASVLSLALLATSAYAEEQKDPPKQKDGETTVVVTARRKALQNAIEIKKNSDTIVDSIVADEAGNLPDKSITEVLQRVSGLTVSRFSSSNGGTPGFQVEGTGVTVRGLPYNTSTLNGRQSFSANGASAISWNEITPELMSGVDAYKASRADLIEGGASSIDLRTRLPFDYKKPANELSLGADYGDLAKKTTGNISGLISRRFDTKIGEMGFLVDLAHSEQTQGQDNGQMGSYLAENNPNVASGWSLIPNGFSWSQGQSERKRDGAYGAFQWRPSDELTLTSTAFYSRYNSVGYNRNAGWSYMPTVTTENIPTNATYDSNGAMTSGSIYIGSTGAADPIFGWGGNNWLQAYIPKSDPNYDYIWKFDWSPDYNKTSENTILTADCRTPYGGTSTSSPDINWGMWAQPGMFYCKPTGGAGGIPLNVTTFSGANDSTSSTLDLSQSFVYNHDNMRAKGAIQYVSSKANSTNFGMGITQRDPRLTSIFFDSTGDNPVFGGLDPDGLLNTDMAHFTSMSYNGNDNKGSALTGNLDFQYDLGDEHFFKEVSFGVRVAKREERDNFRGTYWAALGRDWVSYVLPDGTVSESRPWLTGSKAITGPYTVSVTRKVNGQNVARNITVTPYGTVQPSDYEIYSFPNFFRGAAQSPGTVLSPNINTLRKFDWAHFAALSSEATSDAINAAICAAFPDEDKDSGGKNTCSSNPGNWTPQQYWDTNIDQGLGINNTDVLNQAFYIQTRFASEKRGFVPAFSGNFGVRVVSTELNTEGYLNVNDKSQAFYLSAADTFMSLSDPSTQGTTPHLYKTIGSSVPRSKDFKYARVLPALNVKFDIDPKLILRMAASQGISQPDLNNIRAGGSIEPTVQSLTVGQNQTLYYLQAMTSRGVGSDMKPVMFTNADLSLEWYPKNGTYAYFDVFAKDIKNQDLFDAYYQVQSTPLLDVTDAANPVAVNVDIPWFYIQNRTTSAAEKAEIRGFEVGGRTFFDFLPKPFDGFGASANFTYVDSKNPALLANSVMGTEFVPGGQSKPNCADLPNPDDRTPGNCYNPSNNTDFGDLPYYGMSKYSYNVELYYSKGAFNTRLAYNWRSKQLMSTNANPISYVGRGGTPNVCTAPQCLGGYNQGLVWDLVPLWSADAGYLDFSMDYKLNPNTTIGLQANNLTNTKSKTLQEPLPGVFLPYNTYLSDRRVSVFLRMRY